MKKKKKKAKSSVWGPPCCFRSNEGEINFAARPSALTKKKKANERILLFVTTYHSAVDNLKQTLMELWSLIQTQPLLKIIYLKYAIKSFQRGKSLKDTLLLDQKSKCKTIMRARGDRQNHTRSPCKPATHLLYLIIATHSYNIYLTVILRGRAGYELIYITNEAVGRVGYYQLISGKSEKNNCFSNFSSNSLDFFGRNLLKS